MVALPRERGERSPESRQSSEQGGGNRGRIPPERSNIEGCHSTTEGAFFLAARAGLLARHRPRLIETSAPPLFNSLLTVRVHSDEVEGECRHSRFDNNEFGVVLVLARRAHVHTVGDGRGCGPTRCACIGAERGGGGGGARGGGAARGAAGGAGGGGGAGQGGAAGRGLQDRSRAQRHHTTNSWHPREEVRPWAAMGQDNR